MLAFTKHLPTSLRQRILRSQVRLDERALAKTSVRLAESEAELLGAAGVVHDSFVARGIMQSHLSGLHLRRHSASPDVMVFLATEEQRAIGTISFVIDSSEGLPMDPIYGAELERFRTRGDVVAEVGALAIDPDFRHTGLVFLLNKIMVRTAIDSGVDRLVIAVHPDAAVIYEDTLCFERFGPDKVYPGLESGRSKPVACALASPPLSALAEVYRERFGHLGKKTSNAHYFYFDSENSQIRYPTNFNPRSDSFRRARRALVAVRPDVVARRASLVAEDEHLALVAESNDETERTGT